ncbi:MAG: DNA replication protein [Candidatus Accumulibacter regalis]|jgi:cell division protein ZapE|uniref:DNA replication protein n=1 Tax=Accumulibacter regalis TaxID=522306 RepID=A0A011PU45_ACCRE|nr:MULTISPECIES: cell division protein ZapE [unclassified Candidatus Accumulibacter]EXI90921.1 MAG: DNA replication protein [Candidatus Accumulibacter regalis]MBL8367902.1 AFG1 family ATPase [Accumulibacter sp.]MBN8513829.1 AFG1 family ATPase [Accumulibacter sp.]HRE69534.1 cell division protein ZapE [Accumulibacter sp.]HRE85291.1 cell division protein ZapE [Accumulibacter sp.]
MPHRILKVPERGMLDAYERVLSSRKFTADAAQRTAAERLQRLYYELLSFKVGRSSKLRRFLAPPPVPRGVYFWGGVGRGKSFLMDCFYDAVPYRRKRRVHFHAFMHDVHRQLKQLKGEKDPLARLAERIASELRLLCFDEFHVSDIADAMILGRLLDALFERGVVFVMTSNYPPDRLYPNGLQRENFLPTIALIKSRMDVLEIDSGVDYRLRTLEQVEIFHYPADAAAESKMAGYFTSIAAGVGAAGGSVEILGRQIPTLRRGNGVIWFDFKALCGGPRSQNDYLELALGYHTVLLSAIPRMSSTMASEARRFTWLVDIFYDHKVKLIATADCEPDQLYTEGTQASEFFRTASRLTEMRSREYLGLPHLS